MNSRAILIVGIATIAVAIILAAMLIVKAINAPRTITPINQQNTSQYCDNTVTSQFPVCN